MYRKYRVIKTKVINTHNYLLEAEEIESGKSCMIHQILISSQGLPSIIEANMIQKSISQSQNQNCINEITGNYQFYLEQNLLQIRLKSSLKPITHITKLHTKQILKLINTLNLDFLISTQQIKSLISHNQQNLNHANKFYSQFLLKHQGHQTLLPFIVDDRIQYYDVRFAETFSKNGGKEKRIEEKVLRRRISDRIQKNSQRVKTESLDNQQLGFRKYINFLMGLMSCQDFIQFLQEMKPASMNIQLSKFTKQYQVLIGQITDRALKQLIQLLYRSITYQNQYNLHIFFKQCQILYEKYLKKQQTLIKRPSVQFSIKPTQQKQQKCKNSKSCLILKKQQPCNAKKQLFRASQQKLKTSKSLINLKFKSTPKNRNLKHSNGILSKSKEKFFQKSSILNNSCSSKLNKINRQYPFNGGPSFTANMSSATSNWFAQTMNQNESVFKLRNFKKSNNPSLVGSRFQYTNKNDSVINTEGNAEEDNEKVSEEQLSKFSRIAYKKNAVPSSNEILQSQCDKQDKFTMTEQIPGTKSEAASLVEEKIQNPPIKRQIVSTINFKYYEQLKQKKQLQKKSTKGRLVQEKPAKVRDNYNQQNVQSSENQENLALPQTEKEKTFISNRIEKIQSNNINFQRKNNKQLQNIHNQQQFQMSHKKEQIKNKTTFKKALVQNEVQQINRPQKINNSYDIQKIQQASFVNKGYEKIENPKLKQDLIQKNIHNESVPSIKTPKNMNKKIKQPSKLINKYDTQQIQQISFDNKTAEKISKNIKLQKKPSLEGDAKNQKNHKQKNIQNNVEIQKKKNQKIKNQQYPPSPSKKQPSNQKIIIKLIPQNQKSFYIMNFASALKFYKQNSKNLNIPSKMNNFYFTGNFLYYKTFLEYKSSQKIGQYDGLINLLETKQIKIKQQQKQTCLLYRINFRSLWQMAQKIRQIELDMSNQSGIEQQSLRQRILGAKQQYQTFYILTCQSNKILELIFNEVVTEVHNNKPILIQKKIFLLSLQLIFLIILTMIISTQRQNHYKFMLGGKFNKLQDCFRLKYEIDSQEHIAKYKQSLEKKNIPSINVREEAKELLSWYEQYK